MGKAALKEFVEVEDFLIDAVILPWPEFLEERVGRVTVKLEVTSNDRLKLASKGKRNIPRAFRKVAKLFGAPQAIARKVPLLIFDGAGEKVGEVTVRVGYFSGGRVPHIAIMPEFFNKSVLRHEITHAVLNECGIKVLPPLNEGIAEVVAGLPNGFRSARWLLLRQGPLMSVGELFRQPSFGEVDDIRRRRMLYAQSWLLAYYMLKIRRVRLDTLLRDPNICLQVDLEEARKVVAGMSNAERMRRIFLRFSAKRMRRHRRR